MAKSSKLTAGKTAAAGSAKIHDQKLSRGEGGELHQIASGDIPVLTTAQGGKITVKVKTKPSVSVTLKDRDKNAQDPKAVLKALDLNKGNKQIAHAINRVLRPVDLP